MRGAWNPVCVEETMEKNDVELSYPRSTEMVENPD